MNVRPGSQVRNIVRVVRVCGSGGGRVRMRREGWKVRRRVRRVGRGIVGVWGRCC